MTDSNPLSRFHSSDERSANQAARERLAEVVRNLIVEVLGSRAADEDLSTVRETLERALASLRDRHSDVTNGSFGVSANEQRRQYLSRSPMFGTVNAIAAPLRITQISEGEGASVEARVIFGDPWEGPPGCVHGGFVASAFDEVLGIAQSASGNPGMTVSLKVDYRAPTPLHKELVFRGWCDKREGRKSHTRGTLYCGETLCAEAEGLFVAIDAEIFAKLVQLRDERGQTRDSEL